MYVFIATCRSGPLSIAGEFGGGEDAGGHAPGPR